MEKIRLSYLELGFLNFETEITIDGDEGNFIGINSDNHALGYKLKDDCKAIRLRGKIIMIEKIEYEKALRIFRKHYNTYTNRYDVILKPYFDERGI